MPNDNLHILVLIRETSDPRPPARVITRGAAISERGLRRIPNPLDLAALEEAFRLKEQTGARVTVLTIGPARLDDTVRLAHAMGADRGIRLWDHNLEGGDAVADARVLGRCVELLAPTLVFSGNRLLDRGDDPVPPLAAAMRAMPCLSAAVSLTLTRDGVEVLRTSDRGGRQVVTAPFPCTILFGEGGTPRYPSIDAVAEALDATVETWDMARLGLPFREAGA
ncbi:MAG TPA: electron transfer flavoprotein subunit beta, partial [Desulfuromonadaceae bacterium]